MGIEYYFGTEGPTILVESGKDLWEVLDTLQTQVMDNIKEDDPMVFILGDAMDRLVKECGIDPC